MKGAKSKGAAKAETKLAVKSKGAEKPAPKGRKSKPAKDPNKPKRAPSAFFVFMGEFRKEFNEKNPKNKSVAAVGKAAGERWKSLSESDKAPYVAKANKLKGEYNKAIAAYNKGEVSTSTAAAKKAAPAAKEEDDDEEESDKSKSEINDEDDDEGSDEDEDDDE
nr:HMG1/2-like protein isoform X1 [Lolium perenne]